MEIDKKLDIELVTKAKAGDQQAFAAIMEKYKKAIYFTILKMIHNRDDAQDLLMVTFSKAFNNIQFYKEDYAFSTWLFRIATNTCIDFIRKKKLLLTPIDETMKDTDNDKQAHTLVKDKSADPEEQIIREQKMKQMRAMVEKLSPKYRLLIELRYFEEFSYEEIAAKMDLPLGTVKAQLFRANDMLYKLYNPSKDNF
jgi:RNA polymerase sigma-70 factor (ECF subfamily)